MKNQEVAEPQSPTSLKVAVVCHDLGGGGAARATLRILRAILASAQADISVRLFVAKPSSVLGLDVHHLPTGLSRGRRVASTVRRRLADQLPWSTNNAVIHSKADVWTGLAKSIADWAPDIVHLHWLGTGTLSIEEIGTIEQPIVWTLHDMWPFLGAEHVSYDTRYVDGYARGSRPVGEAGIDWNRRTWRRKQKHWTTPMRIVAPSAWMNEMARSSMLMNSWEISTVPNPIDATFWAPQQRRKARIALGLPLDAPLFLASAVGGMDQLKGGDLLRDAFSEALPWISQKRSAPGLILLGQKQSRPTGFEGLPLNIFNFGRVRDDQIIRSAYSAADVTLVPSRVESFSQVAAESLACGRPVVAFGVGGLLDVVDDRVTGHLVPPFDTVAFASSMCEVLDDARSENALGNAGVTQVRQVFAPKRVGALYLQIYEMARKNSGRYSWGN